MPKCYLLAVSQMSTLDKETNTISLFHLIENLRLGGAEDVFDIKKYQIPMDINAHWYFSKDEFEKEYEFRLVFERDGKVEIGEKVFDFSSKVPRFRMKIRGFELSLLGDIEIKIQWRQVGGSDDEWKITDAFWPISLEFIIPKDKPE